MKKFLEKIYNGVNLNVKKKISRKIDNQKMKLNKTI